MGPTVEIEAEACIEDLAPVAGVRATFAGAGATGAAAVGSAVHSIASVVILAPVAGVRAALAGAGAARAAAVSPAVDAGAGICG